MIDAGTMLADLLGNGVLECPAVPVFVSDAADQPGCLDSAVGLLPDCHHEGERRWPSRRARGLRRDHTVVISRRNSGLGNMVNPLTSLNIRLKHTGPLIITWAQSGRPGEPQQRPYMGG